MLNHYKLNQFSILLKVLECLYRVRWTMNDGLGVLIISPTRELAYQTFEVLKKIGQFHDFSAGLIIGGKVYLDSHYSTIHQSFNHRI